MVWWFGGVPDCCAVQWAQARTNRRPKKHRTKRKLANCLLKDTDWLALKEVVGVGLKEVIVVVDDGGCLFVWGDGKMQSG